MERKHIGLDLIEVKFAEDKPGTFAGYASVFGGVVSSRAPKTTPASTNTPAEIAFPASAE
jgi:hypothetical protein